jgi:hypothetical protein
MTPELRGRIFGKYILGYSDAPRGALAPAERRGRPMPE